MDHLPLPANAKDHWKVPCLSTQSYDNGPFLSFPARHGWQFQPFSQSIEDGVLHNGQVPSLQATQDFLQTWLFFGTLREVLWQTVDLSNFVTTDDGGRRFLCTAKKKQVMNEWIDQNLDAASSDDIQLQDLRDFCRRVRAHLESLYYTLVRVMALADSGTVLATALFGESIEAMIGILYRRMLDTESPIALKWGTAFSELIVPSMNNAGWCSSTATRIMKDSFCLSTLYYFSRLPPPNANVSHTACNDDVCIAWKIDPRGYNAVHTEKHCVCLELSVRPERIEQILRQDQLPLIEISPHQEPPSTNVTVRIDDRNTGFVAISHVWADGLGNETSNSLPACSLQEISRLVDQLPRNSTSQNEDVPFWIDTLCVPLEPPDLKQLALSRMRDPYSRAEHVLILDNYLRSVRAEDCDVLELFARLSCCNWIRRLWTLQEGRLAKRTWFQFQDKAIEFKASFWDGIQTQSPKGSDHRRMLIDIAVVWSATEGIVSMEEKSDAARPELDLLSYLRSTLWSRTVSVAADEALCLFCLADLEMEKILSVPATVISRMTMFWKQMQTVPSGFFFSKARHKLDVPGLRWAPSSFMGPLPRNHWAGSPKVEQSLTGIPTARGLVCNFSGFIFDAVRQDLYEDAYFFFQSAGNWFDAHIREPWHQISASDGQTGSEQVATILMEALPDGPANRIEYDTSEKVRWTAMSFAILGYLTKEESDVKYVKVLHHASIYLMEPSEQLINDTALKCVSNNSFQGDDSVNLTEWAKRITKSCFEEDPAVADACRKWVVGSSYATAADRFAARIEEIASSSKYYAGIAEALAEKQRWGID